MSGITHNVALIICITLCFITPTIIHAQNESKVPPFSCGGASSISYPFCNVGLPVEERVHDLISRLTLDEKIAQLVHEAGGVPRLDVPKYRWWSEAVHGVTIGSTTVTTIFPQVILIASGFDAHLWYRIAKVIGTEARALYNAGETAGLTYWSPTVNIFRDPRWGRGQETPGEDPFLMSTYAKLFVRGVQGDSFEGGALEDGHLLISACCKHFAAYDLERWKEYRRFTFNAQVTKQDMADTYLPAFRSCVEEGKATGIMCSYNFINGVPCCANYDLLTKTARGEWGFKGYIASDCDAVGHIYPLQHYAKSPEEAVADVLKAGLDMNCGAYLLNYTGSALVKGTISESDIDRALVNLFSIRMRLGHFNGDPRKLMYGKLGLADVCSSEHQELALEAAKQGMVLLKNEDKLLPLSKATRSLAVIGPNANATRQILGDYGWVSCNITTPLKGLMSYVGDTKFEEGCAGVNCTSATVERAVALAESVDHVVLVMGLNTWREKENYDRDDLVLPGKQESLIMSVAKAAKRPVVLVLICGGPVDVSFAKHEAKIGSILWAGYPGQSGGRAIAEVIFGDYNPGGRLTMTWYPKDFIKIPMTDMRMRADPSSGYPGRTYRFYNGAKVFEFGYGLSYTTYSYKIILVNRNKLDIKTPSASKNLGYVLVKELGLEWCKKARFSVVVSIENEGEMAGKHPVLLFWKSTQGGGSSPKKQLVGFQTVWTEAKEKLSIQFWVSPCKHFSWANEDGEMVIKLGDGSLVVGDDKYDLCI